MGIVVMKFGGASVATPEHFEKIADIIIAKKMKKDRIVIVVSAMGDTTDRLIALANKVNPDPPRREYDMLVTVGERISIALLAMALAKKNHEAVSFTGSQSGIITCMKHSEATIMDVRPNRLTKSLEEGKIVIVAGFQGVSLDKEITTLGRGGSDTSAVALGVALKADRVEFYKDVLGIYDKDPNKNKDAKLLPKLSYSGALAIARNGSNVLHSRCIELAEKNNIPLLISSFIRDSKGKINGTLIHEYNNLRLNEPIYEKN